MIKSKLLLAFIVSITLGTQVIAQIQKAFTKQAEISLPENYLIGNIEGLDVFGDSYLITDFQQQVFLYKDGTEQLKKLDPRDCFPGFKFHPIHTFHLADGSLFLINAGQPGFRFKPNGDCLDSVDKDFIQVPKQHIAINEGGGFYTIRPMPNEQIILNQYDETGVPINEFDLGNHPFPHFNYRFEGGGMAFQDGVIYYMLASGETIYRFDMENRQFLDEIKFQPSYATSIAQDIPSDPFSGEMFKAIGKILSEHYVIRSIFAISDHFLLIQTSFKEDDESRYGVHFLDLRTQEIKDGLIAEQPFIFARDHKAFQLNDQREDNAEILNPGITIFDVELEKIKTNRRE